jgi:lysozyme family protein
MSNFKQALAVTLKHEGGYVNHPHDPAGETNFGITKAVAVENGYTGSMKAIPMDVVEVIYRKRYWDAIMLDQFPAGTEAIRVELFDSAVNAGVSRAVRWLQASLNALGKGPDIAVDGKMGRGTMSAMQALPARDYPVLLKLLNVYQGSHYAQLCEKEPKFRSFIRGWLTRVF